MEKRNEIWLKHKKMRHFLKKYPIRNLITTVRFLIFPQQTYFISRDTENQGMNDILSPQIIFSAMCIVFDREICLNFRVDKPDAISLTREPTAFIQIFHIIIHLQFLELFIRKMLMRWAVKMKRIA